MRILDCPKWGRCLAALALLSWAAVSTGQEPQGQDGPQLQLTADRTSIKAGERVTLSITPQALAARFGFTVEFQGEPPIVLPPGQTQIQHEYRSPGLYNVTVTPQPVSGLALDIPGLSNNPVTIDVGSIPMTAQPQTVKVGDPVTFTIGFNAPPDAPATYRFNFGDGSSTGWREDPQLTYAYSGPEIYTAKGEVLRKGWTQPISTTPVEVTVETAPLVDDAGQNRQDAPGLTSIVGSVPFWLLVLAGLGTVAFVGHKVRQRYVPPKLAYELHRGGIAGEPGKELEILLKIVLVPGVATGRHYVGKLEMKRAAGPLGEKGNRV